MKNYEQILYIDINLIKQELKFCNNNLSITEKYINNIKADISLQKNNKNKILETNNYLITNNNTLLNKIELLNKDNVLLTIELEKV